MFYISRKVGNRWGVVDTSDNVEEFYSKKALEDVYKRGIDIKGCAYIHRNFVVTPVSLCDNKTIAAKNRIARGTATGIRGFDLKFEGDKVIALKLKKDFLLELEDSSNKKGYVLEIPDIVTHIASNFLDIIDLNTTMRNNFVLGIRIPSSVKEIGSNALGVGYLVDSVEIQGGLDRICRGTQRRTSLVYYDNVISVKCLESYSLTICRVTPIRYYIYGL